MGPNINFQTGEVISSPVMTEAVQNDKKWDWEKIGNVASSILNVVSHAGSGKLPVQTVQTSGGGYSGGSNSMMPMLLIGAVLLILVLKK